ncbi:MAG: hypothetical protein WCA00_08910 [Candidatus Acidiferrales bacterium]
MNRTQRQADFFPVDRKILHVSLAFLFFAVIACAGDAPWKSKPYQQWDDNDIHRILYDSPWSHLATASATWQIPGDRDTYGLQQGSVPPAGNPGGSMPASGGGTMQDAAVGTDRAEYPLAKFYVYWLSSKTIQEALAQRSVLHLGQSPAEAEKRASEPQPDYAVLIQGVDMTPFLRSGEKFFQANSSLQLKKTKEKVAPERVEFRRDAAGKSVVAAIFYFAKKLPGGQPLVLPDEKDIEFTCKVGEKELKVTFEPQKMVAHSGPDL